MSVTGLVSRAHKKNIIICCDGTGNQFGLCNSNVVKLYTAAIIDNKQVGYYHPGVGTMQDPGAKHWWSRNWSVLKGLAFALGFQANVLDAYRYLMEVYDDGDQVFLFGFSRGAYTVRALAGLLHGFGLLCRGNEGHLLYAWRMFVDQLKEKKNKDENSIDPNPAFAETFSRKDFKLHFVGLWDTVSSVGWIYTPLRLLDVALNPLIRVGRHAVSIDERRCFYQDNLWGEPRPHTDGNASPRQDILQVWFAGVHSDVGGSYEQEESALANIALEWLLREAELHGLFVDPDRRRMIFGEPTLQPHQAAPLYRTPAPYWPVHKSLKYLWWILEVLPHRYYDKDDTKQRWRVPLGAHRDIPSGAIIHSSVRERMERHPEYRPGNLLKDELKPLGAEPYGKHASLARFWQYEPSSPKPFRNSRLVRWTSVTVFMVIFTAFLLLLCCPLAWVLHHLHHWKMVVEHRGIHAIDDLCGLAHRLVLLFARSFRIHR